MALEVPDYPLETDPPEEVAHLPGPAQLLGRPLGDVELEERARDLRHRLARHHPHVDLLGLGVDDVSALVPPVLSASELERVDVVSSPHPPYRLRGRSEALPLAARDPYRLRHVAPLCVKVVEQVRLELLRVCVGQPAGVPTHARPRKEPERGVGLAVPLAVPERLHLRQELLLLALLEPSEEKVLVRGDEQQ